MEVFNKLFDAAIDAGVITKINLAAICHQCSLYADDVIIFAHPTVREASAIKQVLTIFGDASGLKTNLSKIKAPSRPSTGLKSR